MSMLMAVLQRDVTYRRHFLSDRCLPTAEGILADVENGEWGSEPRHYLGVLPGEGFDERLHYPSKYRQRFQKRLSRAAG